MNRKQKDQPLHVSQHSSNEMLPAALSSKTVLQELIEYFEQQLRLQRESNIKYTGEEAFFDALEVCRNACKTKEKQQIIEAYTKGQMGLAEIVADHANNRLINKVLGHKVVVPEDDEDGEEYYFQTYGSVV